MIPPKEYYRNYLADNNKSPLNDAVIELVRKQFPIHVLEFGCGTGKNLELMNQKGICALGLDISMMNVIHAHCKGIQCLIRADETYLRNLCNVDVVFTVSVLDHIEKIGGIIKELQRIANKFVFLAETTDKIGEYYFSHNYESYGFQMVHDFKYFSTPPEGDGATYHIWKWRKQNATIVEIDYANDDLGIALK